MRVARNSTNITAYQSKSKRLSKTETKSSVLNALKQKRLAAIKSKSTSTSSDTRTSSSKGSTAVKLLKSYYTKIKKASDAIQEETKQLVSDEAKSLFADAKKTGNTDKVISKVKEFFNNYNIMHTNMNAVGGTANKIYLGQIDTVANTSKAELKELGITQSKDGTFVLDEKSLKKATVDQLEKVMGNTGSFSSKIAEKSIGIGANADTNLTTLHRSTYSAGGTTNNNNTSGSRYNAKA